MYSFNIEDNTSLPECCFPAHISVFLARSSIYQSSTSTEDQSGGTQDPEEEAEVTVPFYPQRGVPLDLLVRELAVRLQRSFYHQQILFRVSREDLYELAGTFPFEQAGLFVPLRSPADPIYLRYRAAVRPPVPALVANSEEDRRGKVRRGNERRIGEVIDALIRWAKLYVYGEQDEGKRYTRKEAARIVNIPKKTLDDYCFQIRLGRRNGFDFDMHCKEKFGVLRGFNRRISCRAY